MPLGNSYVAPNFDLASGGSVSVADLTTLKGSAPAATDYIYIYNNTTLVVESALAIMLISLGETSAGAAADGLRRGNLTVNAGVTVTFTGHSTATNSGIKSNPASAPGTAGESKSSTLTINGTSASPVVFTNSAGAYNTSNAWCIQMPYGNATGQYASFLHMSATTLFASFGAIGATRSVSGFAVNHCTVQGIANNGAAFFVDQTSGTALTFQARFWHVVVGEQGGTVTNLLVDARSSIHDAGRTVDISGWSWARHASGGTCTFRPLSDQASVDTTTLYHGQDVSSVNDVRETEVVPTGLALTALADGSVKVEVSNIADIPTGADLKVYLSDGTQIYSICKEKYQATIGDKPANCGLIRTLAVGTAYTGIKARYTSDLYVYGGYSDGANVTPTSPWRPTVVGKFNPVEV